MVQDLKQRGLLKTFVILGGDLGRIIIAGKI